MKNNPITKIILFILFTLLTPLSYADYVNSPFHPVETEPCPAPDNAPQSCRRSIFHSAPKHDCDPFRTISMDTGYFIEPYSNRAFSDFGVEFFQFHAFLFDLLNDYTPCGHFLLRSLFFYSDLLFSIYLSDVYLTTYHEFGHYTRIQSFGYHPFFIGRPNNFFGFFFEKFGSPFTSEGTGFYYSSSTMTTDRMIIISAAGVNNEMRFAGDLADQTYLAQGHITHFIPYIDGKLSAAQFPLTSSIGNDMTYLITDYRIKGYSISKKDINNANYISLFGSTSTYLYLWGLVSYLYTAETAVTALEFYNFRLPDTEAYFGTHGISLKIKSGYRYDCNTIFPIAYEFIINGDSKHEVTLGIRKKLPEFYNLLLSGNLIIGSALGANVSASYPIHKHFAISGGLEYFNSKTFHGERNITSSSPSTHNIDAWLKLSLVY